MLKSFRYLLLPLSIVYGAIVWFRNFLFDKNILKSSSFNFPLICVGNLALGGTGKTPMVEYLAGLLKDEYQTATLSRGYKRKTAGFAIANEFTTALEIGDEPMQIHSKFPGITVAVGEERLVAIPQLLHEKPGTQAIILDDAFQHRSVRAGMNILLTEYKDLYTRDFMLPAGDLRDVRVSSKRAHIIVITKCDPDLQEQEKQHNPSDQENDQGRDGGKEGSEEVLHEGEPRQATPFRQRKALARPVLWTNGRNRAQSVLQEAHDPRCCADFTI